MSRRPERRSRLEPRARAEEADGVGLGERRDLVLDLALHPQELPARDEQGELGAGFEERGEIGSGLDHLLEVVEEDEHLPLADMRGE